MFLLFLIGLGTAHVNAQVRIGGNAAPNGAAVLDLNATDATTGTKGLALPRVNLTSNIMQITTGVANLNGMMVYNTTATLGAGIYYWSGSVWVKASVPSTVPTDSGKFLMTSGTSVSWQTLRPASLNLTGDTIKLRTDTFSTVVRRVLLDTVFAISMPLNTIVRLPYSGMDFNNSCIARINAGLASAVGWAGYVYVYNIMGFAYTGNMRLVCYDVRS